jgi:hypothetical protein
LYGTQWARDYESGVRSSKLQVEKCFLLLAPGECD